MTKIGGIKNLANLHDNKSVGKSTNKSVLTLAEESLENSSEL